MGKILKQYAKDHDITINNALRAQYKENYKKEKLPFYAPYTDQVKDILKPYQDQLKTLYIETRALEDNFIKFNKAGNTEKATIYFDKLDKKGNEELIIQQTISNISLNNEKEYCRIHYNTREKILNETCKIILCIPGTDAKAYIKRFREIISNGRAGSEIAKQTNKDLCKKYIQYRLRMMLNAAYWAAEHNIKGIEEEILLFIEDRANDFYPSKQNADLLAHDELIPKEFYQLPVAPIQNKTTQSFAYMNNLAKLNQINNDREQINIAKVNNDISIKYKTEKTEISVMSDMKILKDDNLRTLAKPFNFIMVKANEQPAGQKNNFKFTLQDLVNYNLYSSKVSARQQIEKLCTKLIGIKVSCSTQKYINGQEQGFKGFLPLFKALYLDEDRNTVIVKINDEIDEEYLFQFLSPLPRYAFILKTDSFYLLNYISIRTRQNLDTITKNGSFKIYLRKCCEYMGIDTNARKFKEKIKDPIQLAISEIIEQDQGENYDITLNYNDNATRAEYLDNGYIEIVPKGSMIKTLKNLQSRNSKTKENNIKRITKNKH